jgi:hypothetical protein
VPDSSALYSRLFRGPMEIVDAFEAFQPHGGTERFLTRLHGTVRSYDAISESILEPFSRLGSTEEEICDFATQYGYLGETSLITRTRPGEASSGELVSKWIREIYVLKEIYELYAAWKRQDTSELRQRIVWRGHACKEDSAVEFQSSFGSRITIANTSHERYIDRLRQFEHGDVHGPAMFHVQITVNEYLHDHTGTHLFWTTEYAREKQRFVGLDPLHNKPSLYVVPKNLLGAIWLQFARMIDSGSEIQRCATCKVLFATGGGRQTARRTDALFCSNRCRWGRRKLARDLRNKGWTIRQIAKEIQADLSVVRGWVGTT